MHNFTKWFWIILGIIFIGGVEDIFNGDNF